MKSWQRWPFGIHWKLFLLGLLGWPFDKPNHIPVVWANLTVQTYATPPHISYYSTGFNTGTEYRRPLYSSTGRQLGHLSCSAFDSLGTFSEFVTQLTWTCKTVFYFATVIQNLNLLRCGVILYWQLVYCSVSLIMGAKYGLCSLVTRLPLHRCFSCFSGCGSPALIYLMLRHSGLQPLIALFSYRLRNSMKEILLSKCA